MKHDKWIKELVSNTVTFLNCLIIWVVLDPSGTSMHIKKLSPHAQPQKESIIMVIIYRTWLLRSTKKGYLGYNPSCCRQALHQTKLQTGILLMSSLQY